MPGNENVMSLGKLRAQQIATIEMVEKSSPHDPISRRLQELGFIKGENVKLMARGPFGGDPILVQIGFTKFALRLAEANRVKVIL